MNIVEKWAMAVALLATIGSPSFGQTNRNEQALHEILKPGVMMVTDGPALAAIKVDVTKTRKSHRFTLRFLDLQEGRLNGEVSFEPKDVEVFSSDRILLIRPRDSKFEVSITNDKSGRIESVRANRMTVSRTGNSFERVNETFHVNRYQVHSRYGDVPVGGFRLEDGSVLELSWESEAKAILSVRLYNDHARLQAAWEMSQPEVRVHVNGVRSVFLVGKTGNESHRLDFRFSPDDHLSTVSLGEGMSRYVYSILPTENQIRAILPIALDCAALLTRH